MNLMINRQNILKIISIFSLFLLSLLVIAISNMLDGHNLKTPFALESSDKYINSEGQDGKTGMYIVKTRGTSSSEKLESDFDLSSVKTLGNDGKHFLVKGDGVDIENIKKSSLIESMEEDVYFYLKYIPNDYFFSYQWNLKYVNFPQAWDISKGNRSIKIAIIDTGISKNHKDISSKVVVWKDFSESGVYDTEGHGTLVSSIAAASTNNSKGIAGAGHDVSIMSVKITKGDGIYSNVIGDAIRWSVDNGADVINLSFSGTAEPPQYFKDSLNYAYNNNVPVIAAAGNENTDVKNYPAASDHVISVAAINKSGNRSVYSNYGDWVDVAAPGDSIPGAYLNNTYISIDGTSMSTAIVSGLVSLILSQNPNLSVDQVENILCQSALKTGKEGKLWRCGIVDAASALILTSGQSPAPSTSPNPSTSPKPSSPPQGSPGTSTLSFLVRLQGITRKTSDQNFKVEIENEYGDFVTTKISSPNNQDGEYNIYLNSTDVPLTRQMTFKIKSDSHLQKVFVADNVTGNNQTIDYSLDQKDELIAGDATNDNRISIEDMALILSYYTDFSIDVNFSDQKMVSSDVNKDGKITIMDVALSALNWKDFVIAGEE